jgi:hypothetical protein
MGNPLIIGRRYFCCSIAGLVVSDIVAKPPFRAAKIPQLPAHQEFLIVNGWVLTREDLATSDVTTDVV